MSTQLDRLEPLRRRLLSAKDAAAYCGYEGREAVYHVKGFPPPLRGAENERPKWDVRDLDAWIDARKAAAAQPAPANPEITVAEHRAAARALVAKSRRRGRPGKHAQVSLDRAGEARPEPR